MADLDNLSPAAAAAWQRLSQSWGQPLQPISGYRSADYNRKVGGARNSQHVHGNAIDITVAGMPREQRVALIEAARGAGFRGIGVYDNSLHFDVGPERAWGPSYGRESLPQWAASAVGAQGLVGGAGGDTLPSGNALSGLGMPATGPQEPSPEMLRIMELNALAQLMPQRRSNRLDPRDFMQPLQPQQPVNYLAV